MRTKTKVLSLKLTDTETQCLHQLVCMGKYPSVSAALRAGMLMVLELHKLGPVTKAKIASERRIHRPRQGKVRGMKLDLTPIG